MAQYHVPLIIRGNTIGAILLALARAVRRYNLFDLALAEDLADRVAIALDNATLYTKDLETNRQESSFTTRMHGGLGVGLAIVRYIVERHGGAVRAGSRGEGQGATFVVDLPY